MAKPLSELIKAVNKEPQRRTLEYKEETYEYWSTDITMGERERVKATQKDKEDNNEFGLKLLIKKALKKDGSKMFQPCQYAELKEEWPAAELEEAMMGLLGKDEVEAEEQEGNAKGKG